MKVTVTESVRVCALLAVIAAVMLLPRFAFAVDPIADAELKTMVVQAKESYDQITTELDKAQTQIDKLQNIYGDVQGVNNALHGDYHIAGLFNGEGDLRNRLLNAPGTYADGLRYMKSGVDSQYQSLEGTYNDAHPYLSEAEYRKMVPDGEGYKEYQHAYQQNRTMNVQAQHAYNMVGKDEKKNYQLSNTKTPNLKASVDLNNRLLVENNNIKLKLIRLEALKLQQQAGVNGEALNETAALAKSEGH